MDLTRELDALMAAGNNSGKPATGYDEFLAHVQRYVDAADPRSLAGLFAQAPHDDSTQVAGQVIHWIFAMGDTLAANVMRSLALLASHPEQLHEVRVELDKISLDDAQGVAGLDYLAGCLLEAMRLWPTTPLFGRVTTREVKFPGGEVLERRHPGAHLQRLQPPQQAAGSYADRFSPGEWAIWRRIEELAVQLLQQRSAGLSRSGPRDLPGAGVPCEPAGVVDSDARWSLAQSGPAAAAHPRRLRLLDRARQPRLSDARG